MSFNSKALLWGSEAEDVDLSVILAQQQGYNPFKIMRQVHESGAGLKGLF